MSESYVEVREDGSVRLAGTLAYPEATVADVLTVQADGSIAAAAAGGGSSPLMLGPFAVTKTTLPDNGDPLHLCDLDAGQILLAVSLTVSASWPDTWTAGMLISDRGDLTTSAQYGASVLPLDGQGSSTPTPGIYQLKSALTSVWAYIQADAELMIYGDTTTMDPISGAAQVYAMVYTPPA